MSSRPNNKRPPRQYHSNVTTSSEYSTTIRAHLNPFRITEEPRQSNFTVALLQAIVRVLQDIINKTSNIQQQLILNGIFTHLQSISNNIDQINSDSNKISFSPNLPELTPEFVRLHLPQTPIVRDTPDSDEPSLVINEQPRIIF